MRSEKRDSKYCDLSCIDGCFCPAGFVRLDDESCVRPEECPCRMQNAEFPPGTVMEKNCQNCTCIGGRFHCVGRPCREDGGISENRCNNPATEFYCRDNSTCIPKIWRCDGVPDCSNGEDEKNCGNGENDNNGDNFDRNGETRDNSEKNRPKIQNCEFPELEWMCSDKTECVSIGFICDGTIDCSDGSDEDSCRDKFECGGNEFTCKQNGRCISNEYVCDGQLDCGFGDYSDENECSDGNWGTEGDDGRGKDGKNDRNCQNHEFKCKFTKECIPRKLRCNGALHDCQDDSDEMNCHCPPFSHYECGDGLCIVREKVCDRVSDCRTGEDELDCGSGNGNTGVDGKTPNLPNLKCQSHEFPCYNSTVCAVMCDGIDTCGFDERNCNEIGTDGVACPFQQFKCRDNQKCVPRVWICDGQEDCADGSDELGCKPKEGVWKWVFSSFDRNIPFFRKSHFFRISTLFSCAKQTRLPATTD